jgi:tight adherence protein B
MDPLAAITALSIMTTVVLLMFAFWGSAIPNAAVKSRLQGLMSGTSVVEPTTAEALRASKPERGMFSGITKGNIGERLVVELERADLNVTPGEFIAARIILLVLGLVVPFFALQGRFEGIIISVICAVIGYNIPKLYLNHRRKSRVAKLNAQLPEGLTIISNSLKAGFGLLQALQSASEHLAHPISTELSRTIHEMNIGSSAEEALVALSERSGSYDLDIVVTAILVQRTVGGNLGEILDTVAETMRERIRIRGEIQTLTAQQKLTGMVIGGLPIAVAILFQVMSPGYIAPLFTTLTGKFMLGVAVVLEVVGVMIIQRVLNIEV